MDGNTTDRAGSRRLPRPARSLARARPDVQNIDLMTLAGFCRNCLCALVPEAAAERGLTCRARRRARRFMACPRRTGSRAAPDARPRQAALYRQSLTPDGQGTGREPRR